MDIIYYEIFCLIVSVVIIGKTIIEAAIDSAIITEKKKKNKAAQSG